MKLSMSSDIVLLLQEKTYFLNSPLQNLGKNKCCNKAGSCLTLFDLLSIVWPEKFKDLIFRSVCVMTTSSNPSKVTAGAGLKLAPSSTLSHCLFSHEANHQAQ